MNIEDKTPVDAALNEKSVSIIQEQLVAELKLSELSQAEEKILRAVSEYVAIKKREGSHAHRTIKMLRRRGLLKMAEVAVAKKKPTQGFHTLNDKGPSKLSFEQIILDHPEEFSLRAVWYSRRTLNLPNSTDKPPAFDSPEKERSRYPADTGYWVLVNNPKRWSLDKFLRSDKKTGEWGMGKNDASKAGPGQLAIVRVGVDQRSKTEREGYAKLEAGIYALCEVTSAAYPGAGASPEFWGDGKGREPGWPTVSVRYIKSFLDQPLTIDCIKRKARNINQKLIAGVQNSSFAISEDDFLSVLSMLEVDIDEIRIGLIQDEVDAENLASMEERYLNASPQVKTALSKKIERGSIGMLVKKRNNFKCQLCEAIGRTPHGFQKRDGEPYVEAHHVMPVSKLHIGCLAASNIVTLCANHHREVHYGHTEVAIREDSFDFEINKMTYRLTKSKLVSN